MLRTELFLKLKKYTQDLKIFENPEWMMSDDENRIGRKAGRVYEKYYRRVALYQSRIYAQAEALLLDASHVAMKHSGEESPRTKMVNVCCFISFLSNTKK